MCKAQFQNYLKFSLVNISLSMKEPTRTKMSVVLTNLRERKWGEDGVKRLWDCQNLCLLRAQCIAAAIHSCHPQSA